MLKIVKKCHLILKKGSVVLDVMCISVGLADSSIFNQVFNLCKASVLTTWRYGCPSDNGSTQQNHRQLCVVYLLNLFIKRNFLLNVSIKVLQTQLMGQRCQCSLNSYSVRTNFYIVRVYTVHMSRTRLF